MTFHIVSKPTWLDEFYKNLYWKLAPLLFNIFINDIFSQLKGQIFMILLKMAVLTPVIVMSLLNMSNFEYYCDPVIVIFLLFWVTLSIYLFIYDLFIVDYDTPINNCENWYLKWSHMVNACLTESAKVLFCSHFFMLDLKASRDSAFFSWAEVAPKF